MALAFTIRPYTKKDLPDILEMIRELAIFEKAAEKLTNTVGQMEKEMAFFECFIAEDDQGQVLGMALYYPVYYTWVGKSMYLDDLVVREIYRGNGIGTALLNKVIEQAKETGCKRLRWQVLEWNERAIQLYERYGCTLDGEWMNCDLSFI